MFKFLAKLFRKPAAALVAVPAIRIDFVTMKPSERKDAYVWGGVAHFGGRR